MSSDSGEEKVISTEEEILVQDAKLLRKATWKVDLVVIPIVGMYYLLSFLDRANIGNARIAGFQKDLNITNHQYSVALTTTYVPYIAMELPMNLLMKRVGANITLPLMVVIWGIITTCQGTVTSYSGLLAARFFLGAAEGGLFPGIILYMSSFYRRHDLQLRVTMMFSVTSLAGAFSGLLAAAIQQLGGKRGKAGWAWIFILEGIFTVVFGLFSFLVIPRDPRALKVLSSKEKEAYLEQLREDGGGDVDDERFSWRNALSPLGSVHMYLLAVPLFCSGAMLFGLAFFSPTIVNALGNSVNRSQLLTVPPYACSFVVGIVCSYFSDKYRQRGVMAISMCLIAMIGYILFFVSANRHIDYAALFLQIIGSYSLAPCLSTWVANNFWGHYRRAGAIAFAFVMTNSGGILSTWIFNDAPRFRKATRINIAFSVVSAVASLVIVLYFRWQNQQKTKAVRVGVVDESSKERVRLGDRHPLFLYTP